MTSIPITPSIRAYRILEKTPTYFKATNPEDWLMHLGGPSLGSPVGYYRNPDKPKEVIGIFDQGLAWPESSGPVRLRFADLEHATLPTGMYCEYIELETRKGERYRVPITARRGKFVDSLQMLRFIMRCIGDARVNVS